MRDMYFLDKFFAPSPSTEFVSEERFLKLVKQQRIALKLGSPRKRQSKP